MPRPRLARSGVLVAVLLLGAPAGALAHPGRSGRRHAPACTARKSATAKHGSRSFRRLHCAKGRHVPLSSHPSSQPFFSARGGVCPDANLAPSATDLKLVRAATLCLVNRERASHGERALHWNEQLIQAAQSHTESMAFGDYFEHVSPRGETPLMRMRRTGYIYSSRISYEVGENIAWGSLWLGTPSAVVAAWMRSPGHRANILDAHFRETGIGVSPHVSAFAPGQSGGIYTQDFGVRTG